MKAMPAKKQRSQSAKPFMPGDSRYDKPFRYLRNYDCYLVTLQKKTTKQPGLYDVIPGHGDRAIPKGIIQVKSNSSFEAYLYRPGFTADLLATIPLDDFPTLESAISYILEQ
jgi:hypothetical protein